MPKKPAAERKELRVSVRVTPQLKKRIESAEEITGLPESQVVVRSLEAFCDYVERHGEFTVPFAVVPQSSLPPYLSSNPAPAAEPGYNDYLRALQEAGERAPGAPVGLAEHFHIKATAALATKTTRAASTPAPTPPAPKPAAPR